MSVVALSVFVRTQPASLLLEPAVRSLAIAAATALVASAWIAAWVARRDEWRAMAWTFSGLAMLYGAVVIGWPVSGRAREMVILRETIARQRRAGAGEIVSYRTFLKGLPWLLKSPVPFVDAGGELAEGTKAIRSSDDPIAWTEARFWKRWEDDRPLLALVKETDLAAFERRGGGVPFIIARARRHLLVSNSTPLSYPSSDPWTSTALYWSHAQPHTTPVPLASVPPRVVAGARRELEGRSIVRSFVERTKRGFAYEFASGGSLPRIVEVEPSGEATYTEEMVREAELPHDVLETFKRVSPKSTVVFLTRERPLNGEPDRYQMYIAGQRGLREMGIDESAYSRE
jgi:hypothetical protein